MSYSLSKTDHFIIERLMFLMKLMQNSQTKPLLSQPFPGLRQHCLIGGISTRSFPRRTNPARSRAAPLPVPRQRPNRKLRPRQRPRPRVSHFLLSRRGRAGTRFPFWGWTMDTLGLLVAGCAQKKHDLSTLVWLWPKAFTYTSIIICPFLFGDDSGWPHPWNGDMVPKIVRGDLRVESLRLIQFYPLPQCQGGHFSRICQNKMIHKKKCLLIMCGGRGL